MKTDAFLDAPSRQRQRRTLLSVFASLVLLAACLPTPAPAAVLIETNAVWKYLDNGTDPGNTWHSPFYDDNSWASGPAQLGFGDFDEATTLTGGQGYITYYFRHTFNVSNASSIDLLNLTILYDDGVVVYLNGTEVRRLNMPSGTIANNTLALAAIGDNFVSQTFLSSEWLMEGANVLAVEVHQVNGTSSDISFAAGLSDQYDFRVQDMAYADGQATFAIEGVPNHIIRVQSTTNLNQATWVNLGLPVTNVGGFTRFTNQTASAMRYYRAIDLTDLGIYTENVSGFVVLPVAAGGDFIANPLSKGNNTIAEILPQPPDGVSVFAVGSLGAPIGSSYLDGWSDLSLALVPGKGIFLRNPTGGTIDLTFTGDVASGSNSVFFGYNLLSEIIPKADGLEAAGYPASDGDGILFWNPAIESFDENYTFIAGLGWVDSEFNLVDPTPNIGQAFWLIRAAANSTAWVQLFDPAGPILSLAGPAFAGSASGQVNLLTYHATDPGFGRVLAADLLTPLNSSYRGQLYAGTTASEANLIPAGAPATFGTGNGAGYLNAGIVSLSGISAPPGTIVHLQLRAWRAADGASYEEAQSMGGPNGKSSLFTVTAGGNLTPFAAPDANGFPSFSLLGGASPPSITMHPQSQTVAVGAVAFFSVAATGTTPMGYQWKFNGIDIPGATSSNLVINNAQLSDAGPYTVTVANVYGSTTSSNAVLTVEEPPLFIVHPQRQTVVRGQHATFTAEVSGAPPFMFLWRKNTQVLEARYQSAPRSVWTLPNVEVGQAGSYNVVVTNGWAPAGITSSSAVLTVLTNPPIPLDLTMNIGSGFNGPVASILVQPDQKIVVAGDFTSYNGEPWGGVVRLDSNGAPDAGFDPGMGALGSILAVARQTNDSLILGGSFDSFDGTPQRYLVRLLPDGSLDSGFVPGTGPDDRVNAIAVQEDGRILIAGNFLSYNGTGRTRLARLLPDGGLDDSFSSGSTLTGEVHSLQSQAGGNVLVAGNFGAGIIRILADGTQDPNFPVAITGTAVNEMKVQPDGKVVLGGDFTAVHGVARSRVARVFLDGSVDLVFDPGAGANGVVHALALQGDGRILVGGAFTSFRNLSYTRLVRVLSNGSVDDTLDTGLGANANIDAIALDAEERILIGGAFTTFQGVERYGFARLLGTSLAVPTITVQPISQSVAAGQPVGFTVMAQASPAPSFQWRRNGLDLLGQTNQTLLFESAQPGDAGTYTVVVSNPVGYVISDPANLTVESPPQITQDPLSQVAVLGATVTFQVTATGSLPLTYQWWRKQSPLSGQTASTLTLVNIQTLQSGSYFVVVSNEFGAAPSAEAMLVVLTPPSITLQPPSTNVLLGEPLTLCVAATGSDPIRFQWRKNGVRLAGETNNCLHIPIVGVTHGGTYTVVAINAAGALSSDPAVVAVQVFELVAGDLFDDRVLFEEAVVRASNVGATMESGEPNHAGQPPRRSVWYTRQIFGDGIVTLRTSGSTFDTLLAVYTGDSVDNLQLVVSDEDQAGFFASEVKFAVRTEDVFQIAIDGFDGASGDFLLSWSQEFTSDILPVIIQQPTGKTVPRGGEAMFEVVAVGDELSYQWFRNDSLLENETGSTLFVTDVQPSDLGTYTVAVTNPFNRTVLSLGAVLEIGSNAGIQSADKISNPSLNELTNTLQAVPGKGILISPALTGSGGLGLLVGAGTTDSQIFSSANSFVQPGEPNHCGVLGGSTRWMIFRTDQSGLDFTFDTDGSEIPTVLAVYSRNSFQEPLVEQGCGTADGLISSVTIAAIADTDYWVAVDGVEGVQGIVQLNWRLGVAPQVVTETLDYTVVSGESVTLSAPMPDAFPEPRFQWLHNDQPITGAVSQTYRVPDTQRIHGGIYSVVVSNLMGAVTQQVALLSVDADFAVTERSLFDTGDDGWRIWAEEQLLEPIYTPFGGSEGGHISHDNSVTPGPWYWLAPEGWLGNQSAVYGGEWRFDLRQTGATAPAEPVEAMLVGAGLTLVTTLPAPAEALWTPYSILLREHDEWAMTSAGGPPPTRETFLRVLSSLDALLIRGDLSVAPHATGLDQVRLTAPVETEVTVLKARFEQGEEVMLEWPDNAPGFQLEGASQADSESWQPVAAVPTVQDGMRLQSIDPASGLRYFRLRKP